MTWFHNYRSLKRVENEWLSAISATWSPIVERKGIKRIVGFYLFSNFPSSAAAVSHTIKEDLGQGQLYLFFPRSTQGRGASSAHRSCFFLRHKIIRLCRVMCAQMGSRVDNCLLIGLVIRWTFTHQPMGLTSPFSVPGLNECEAH